MDQISKGCDYPEDLYTKGNGQEGWVYNVCFLFSFF